MGERISKGAAMTLLIVLHGSDGLVMAADSRGTFGDPRGVTAQNDTMIKARLISPHVAVLIAGSAEVGSLVLEEFRKQVIEEEIDNVETIVLKLREHVRARYTEWFPSLLPITAPALVQSGQVAPRPDLVYLIGGYNRADGELSKRPLIYQLNSAMDFSPMFHDYGFAVAGIGQYALYLLNRLYQQNRSVEELSALAVYVITETASQDGKVGGPVKVVAIRESGGELLTEEAVQNIVGANEVRSEALRSSFYQAETN